MNKFFAISALLILSLVLRATPVSAQGDTLTVGIVLSIKTMDPQNTTAGVMYGVAMHINETLVAVENGKIVPLLAESWKMLDDKVTYEFTLKQGVKFHNGDIMTADDVVYSFKRALSPAGAATKAQSMYLAEVGKKDERTIYLKAVAPMGQAFLGNLSHPWASIFSEKYTEAKGLDYGQQPMGTGKFKLKRAVAGDRVELERFDDYHGTKAKVKNLIFRTIVEAASRTIELESGAVDAVTDIAPIDTNRIKDNPKLELIAVPSYRLHHLGFDVTLPPYDNPKVRQAINMAINRPGIVKAVLRGLGESARGVLPSTIDYSSYKDSADLPYNPEKARELLKEAGYPNGFKGVLITSERSDYQNIATVVQNNLQQVGIDMQIKIIESGAYNDFIGRPKHDPFIYNWGGNVPTADPFFYLTPLYHSRNIGQANRYYFSNAELDDLLDKGVQAEEGKERAAFYAEAWKLLNRELPQISILSPVNTYGKTKNLKGVAFSPTAINFFGNAYFE
ncbi:MAG: ABC transporter substrate-binding protein [Desulfovibrio sp.]|jgi:peptide/nickel transport system substrate-binding protein|nr:ABC transporter substrate-binding protein [Desulfovibrio sp.]